MIRLFSYRLDSVLTFSGPYRKVTDFYYTPLGSGCRIVVMVKGAVETQINKQHLNALEHL